MEKKNEMTEMEVGDEDWFGCWIYHQHDGNMSLGLQKRIWEKMREHKEHYTAEQQLAVSSRMFMDELKLQKNLTEILEEKYHGMETELNEAITELKELREGAEEYDAIAKCNEEQADEIQELEEANEELEEANGELRGMVDSAQKKVKDLLDILC